MRLIIGCGRKPATLALAIIGIGCGGSAGSDAIAEDTPPPPAWSLEPQVRIDGQAHLLNTIGIARLARTGELVVSQPEQREFIVVSPSGSIVRRMGGKGSGPGEFLVVRQFGFVGDTMWADDPGQRRLTFFGLNGRVQRTLPYAPSSIVKSWRNLVEERLIASEVDFTVLGPMLIAPGGTAVTMPNVLEDQKLRIYYPRIPLIGVDRSLTPIRILAWVPTSATRYVSPKINRETAVHAPFGKEVLATVASSDGSRVSIVAADYNAKQIRVTQISAIGDTISTRSFPFQPEPVAADAIARFAKAEAARSGRPEDADAIREALERLPRFRTPFTSAMVLDDGALWLQRVNGREQTWRYVDTVGGVLGEIELTAGQRALAFDTDHVWIVDRGADDIPSITRYRIRRPETQ